MSPTKMARPFLAQPVPNSLRKSFEKLDAALWIAVNSWMRSHGKVRSSVVSADAEINLRISLSRVMQIIKPKLSDEQKRQLKMTFNLMDADGGGTIDGGALTIEF